ncbi:MAG: FkbM family methyltransferase [Succinivibrio sp.]|nr:FkbM family methyltransferase [Succinivibrio sp.]
MKEKTENTTLSINQQVLEQKLASDENFKVQVLENLNELRAAVTCVYKIYNDLFDFVFADEEFTFYLPDLPRDLIQRLIVLNSSFYKIDVLEAVRQKYLKPGMKIVDIGANIGNHSIFFSTIAKAGSVEAFEPQQHLCKALERNLDLNQVKNVKLHQAVCADQKGKASIAVNALGNLAATQFKVDANGTYTAVTLDDTIKGGCDFIRIASEGLELQIIKGAQKLIERCHPIILVEVKNKAEFEQIAQSLAVLGYKSFTRFGLNDCVFSTEDASKA